LFIELQLPPNGDPTSTPGPRSLAPKRGGAPRRGRGKPQYSTSKDILEKLKKLHPLPGVILEWRRITNALTKTVFPLQKEKVNFEDFNSQLALKKLNKPDYFVKASIKCL
jgi:DNA polymerase theta